MLKDIRRRVSKLEGQIGRKGFPIIIVHQGETQEEAEEKHFLKNPADRERVLMVVDCSRAAEEPREGPPPRPGQEQPQIQSRREIFEDDKPLQITR
jgi:hypothetical protein